MSIPEPLSFTGGPDDTGRYIGRSTGPRREPDDLRPVCHRCGNPCHVVHSLADVGTYCSIVCLHAATEPQESRRTA